MPVVAPEAVAVIVQAESKGSFSCPGRQIGHEPHNRTHASDIPLQFLHRHGGGKRYDQLVGIQTGTDARQHLLHLMRLDGENHNAGLPHEVFRSFRPRHASRSFRRTQSIHLRTGMIMADQAQRFMRAQAAHNRSAHIAAADAADCGEADAFPCLPGKRAHPTISSALKK